MQSHIANTPRLADAGGRTPFVNKLFDEYAETGVTGALLLNQRVDGANARSFDTNVALPRAVGVRFSWNVF